jgi:hypothetical protein
MKSFKILLILFLFPFFNLFSQYHPAYTLQVSSGEVTKNLTIGLNPFGTDGIDTSLGEYNLPPYTPEEFDARFRLPDTSLTSYKDIRYGCGWAAAGYFFLEWRNGDQVTIKGDPQQFPLIYSLSIKHPDTGEILAQLDDNYHDSIYYTAPTGLDNVVLEVMFNGTLSWGSISFNSIKIGELIPAGEEKLLEWDMSSGGPGYATDILLSMDYGQTWSTIVEGLPPSQASYLWNVPDISSNQCIIRIGDYPCLYQQVGTFFIYQDEKPELYPVPIPITFRNGNNESITLTAGLHPEASSSGLDTALGEYPHSFALNGTFDAAFPIGQSYSRNNFQLGHHLVYGYRNFLMRVQPGADSVIILEADLPQGVSAELEYQKQMPYGVIPEKKILGAGNIQFNLPRNSINMIYSFFTLKLFYDYAVPVELISFNAEIFDNDVKLNWATATETNNAGFELQRSTSNEEFKRIGFIEGNGTSTERNIYNFIDKNLNPGKYCYRLKQLDYDGSFVYSIEIEAEIKSRDKFTLYQNYPNPFNPSTNIDFHIPQAGLVSLKIYDVLGDEIKTLVNEVKQIGNYAVEFNGSELSSGVYFCQLKAGSFSQTRKLILIK